MIRVHKIRLRPTKEQEQHLFRACVAARNAYNWGLEQLNLEYDIKRDLFKNHQIQSTPSFTHARQLKKLYNQIKDKNLVHNTGTATQEAFDDLQRSIQRYWDIQTGKIIIPKSNKPRKDGRRQGWPRFRNRFKHNSFRVTYTSLKAKDKYIQYSRAIGPIRMCEELRFDGDIRNAVFSWDGLWWYASIQIDIGVSKSAHPNSDAVGIDLGIKYLAVTSDGELIENPQAFYQAQKRLRRLQRKLDRQRRANNSENYNPDGTVKKGPKSWQKSNRMKETELAIKKLHKRINDIRQDASHKFTRSMTENYGVIAIEDLNIRGMLKNGKLSKAISDAALFEKRRQLTYKAEETGSTVVTVDQWFPSSKKCNNCDFINAELKLSERGWLCPNCGVDNHRDGNAAKNIRDEGLRILYDSPQVRGAMGGR